MTIFGTLTPDGKLTNVREISQADLMRCPFAILVAEHYREDGSCKCNSRHERARMVRDWGYTEHDFDGIPLQEEM